MSATSSVQKIILFENSSVSNTPRTKREQENDPEKLDISRKNLHTCPNFNEELRLKMLNMQSNYISKIDGIECLVNLVCLDLYNNQLESVEAISQLFQLRVLMLGKNRIFSLQPLKSLQLIDILDLHSNQISSIVFFCSKLLFSRGVLNNCKTYGC